MPTRIISSFDTILFPEECNMIPSFSLESLENRQLLSVAAPAVAEARPVFQPAVTVRVAQPRLVASSYFLGSPTLGGISGKLALKIKTVSGTAVTATLYSTDFGGFNVAVTGTITSAGAISLTGKSATCTVTSFKGTLSSTSKVISGSCTVVQNGVTLTGKITETRSATAPVLTTPTYPSLLGKYSGVLNDGSHVTINITKQSGGLFWGNSNNGGVTTGFQSAPGVFRMHDVDKSGYTNITGSKQSGGSLSCSFKNYGTDGSTSAGTFVLNKV
jgi:hypothetical protein